MAREKLTDTEREAMETAEQTLEGVVTAPDMEASESNEENIMGSENSEAETMNSDSSIPDTMDDETEENESDSKKVAGSGRTRNGRRRANNPANLVNSNEIVTINKNSLSAKIRNNTEESLHELQNSRITRKILTGILSAIEKKRISEDQTMQVAIVDYMGIRVMIPLSEMNIVIRNVETADSKDSVATRQLKIISNMIGCEIDFVVTAVSENNVVASRKEAMRKKMQDFYIGQDGDSPLILPGTKAEARVIAVAQNALRLEIFGVECFTRVLDMQKAWVSDARDVYDIGDIVLVRIVKVNIENNSVTAIEAEAKSLDTSEDEICKQGSQYLGTVTGSNNGTIFVRLRQNTNAIAHSCHAPGPKPGVKDEVKFVCTRMDVENNVAIGIITKVIHRSNV